MSYVIPRHFGRKTRRAISKVAGKNYNVLITRQKSKYRLVNPSALLHFPTPNNVKETINKERRVRCALLHTGKGSKHLLKKKQPAQVPNNKKTGGIVYYTRQEEWDGMGSRGRNRFDNQGGLVQKFSATERNQHSYIPMHQPTRRRKSVPSERSHLDLRAWVSNTSRFGAPDDQGTKRSRVDVRK